MLCYNENLVVVLPSMKADGKFCRNDFTVDSGTSKTGLQNYTELKIVHHVMKHFVFLHGLLRLWISFMRFWNKNWANRYVYFFFTYPNLKIQQAPPFADRPKWILGYNVFGAVCNSVSIRYPFYWYLGLKCNGHLCNQSHQSLSRSVSEHSQLILLILKSRTLWATRSNHSK